MVVFPRSVPNMFSCYSLDRLQFTITSRKEMPNARFVEEIAKAADDLKVLFETQSKARL